MKKHSLLCLLLGLTVFYTNAQLPASRSFYDEKTVILKITPSHTDPTIKAADTPHLVLYDPTIKQGKLLLFMPGTNGIASRGPAKLFATAIQQGYRVINLSYINFPAGVTTCFGQTLADDPDCIEKFRIKRIYGENVTPLFPDEPQDAIMNRFTKLLIYLAKTDKQGNWEMYLENGAPKWEEIALAGQSQGGGMAAYIAKRTHVAKVISFSGGWDQSSKNQIAKWYARPSVTPAKNWYGIYHTEEPKANLILASYQAMGIPKSQIYPLALPVKQGRKAHGEGIANTAYSQQWIEILGKGN